MTELYESIQVEKSDVAKEVRALHDDGRTSDYIELRESATTFLEKDEKRIKGILNQIGLHENIYTNSFDGSVTNLENQTNQYEVLASELKNEINDATFLSHYFTEDEIIEGISRRIKEKSSIIYHSVINILSSMGDEDLMKEDIARQHEFSEETSFYEEMHTEGDDNRPGVDLIFEEYGVIDNQTFQNNFLGLENYRQSSVGNCRMLSGLDSMFNQDSFKQLIQENVKCKVSDSGTSFIFRLPMDGTSNEYFHVTDRYFENDVYKSLAETDSIGLTALLIALGQKITGARDFNPEDLGGGTPIDLRKHLLGEKINTYEIFNTEDTNGLIVDLLRNFNEEKQLIALSIRTQEEVENVFGIPDHGVSLEHINYSNGDINEVVLSDPYGHLYPLSVEDFLEHVLIFNIGSLEEISGVSDFKSGNGFMIDQSKYQKNNDMAVNNIVVSTGKKSYLEQFQRNMTYTEGESIYSGMMESWSKKTHIQFDRNEYDIPEFTFEGGGNTLVLNPYLFDDYFEGYNLDEYRFSLYPQKLANFLNKVRKKRVDGDSKNSFEITNSSLMKGDEIVLSSGYWGLLGISDNDTDTLFELIRLK